MDDRTNSYVIVAIPENRDPTWKVSSEKVPHMTLCYLGNTIDAQQQIRVLEYLEHVIKTNMTESFGMTVERRGTLGPEGADVLFFKPNKKLEEFRNYLLQNNDFSQLYNSVPQYPTFTPHLTLGYPDRPANADDRYEPKLHWVEFDRIALWTGDSEGPEFLLTQGGLEVSMSTLSATDYITEYLSHYGKLGMKWGIVRDKLRGGPDSKDFSQVKDLRARAKKGGPRTLSDKELNKLLNRMELEKKYDKIANETKDEGRKFLIDLLGTIGKEVFSTLLKEKVKSNFRRRDSRIFDGKIIEAGSRAIGSK